MQEISIKGLQSNLKSKAKIQMLKKDIGIEALDKIYNQKYKLYIYIYIYIYYHWVSTSVVPNSLPSNSKRGRF
jgi:hypothetical protein